MEVSSTVSCSEQCFPMFHFSSLVSSDSVKPTNHVWSRKFTLIYLRKMSLGQRSSFDKRVFYGSDRAKRFHSGFITERNLATSVILNLAVHRGWGKDNAKTNAQGNNLPGFKKAISPILCWSFEKSKILAQQLFLLALDQYCLGWSENRSNKIWSLFSCAVLEIKNW